MSECACCRIGGFDPDNLNDPDGYSDECFCGHTRLKHQNR